MSEDLRFQIVLGDGNGPDGLELVFTYRLLGREEYRGILETTEDVAEIDELVCMYCVEEEYDWRGGLAGAATTVAESILASSGLAEGQADFLLGLFRSELYRNIDYQRDCIIVEAFPNLDIEEIQNWPVVKHLYYFSRAEYILSAIRGKNVRYISEDDLLASERVQKVQSPSQRAAAAPPPDWGEPVERVEVTNQPKPPASNGGAMTEEQLLAMLGASNVSTELDHESMNYHIHKDSVTGDYD
ncbi:hypothetical protein C0431_13285 [bacterium]|nr:hypothetical protein [bacterium]